MGPKVTKKLFSNITFVAVIALAVAARLAMTHLGGNFDLGSYAIISNLVLDGQSVYAGTERYNYGPIWFLLIGLFRELIIFFNVEDIPQFHLVIAGFLSLVDVLTAIVLKRHFGLLTACVFLLNPVSLLVTGYQSQFDNFAILVALYSWYLISRFDKNAEKLVLPAALLLGLSLAIKHLCIFFPIWAAVVFWRNGQRRAAITYLIVPYIIFALSFAPFLFQPGAVEGILEHVVHYKNPGPDSLLTSILKLLIPSAVMSNVTGAEFFKNLFVALIIGVGLIVSRPYSRKLSLVKKDSAFQEGNLFGLYLVSLVVLTSVMADQYLAIPLTVCAIFYRSPLIWIYTFAATLKLCTSSDGWSYPIFHWKDFMPFYAVQIWLLLFLAWTIWKELRSVKSAARPTLLPS